MYIYYDVVGFFPNGGITSTSNTNGAVCVASCPTVANQVTNCLADSVNCISGTFTPTYTSFAINSYCIPNSIADGVNIESIFKFNSYEKWAYDLREGWIVLLVAALAAIVLSLVFFVFVRLCAGPIIWLCIIIAVLGMLTVGIFFLLQAKGIVVSDFISQNLNQFSYDTLIIAGSCLIGASVLLALLTICLRSRIALGSKAVELGSMFLLSNCYLVILPITQGILIIFSLGGLIAGAVGLYSMGNFGFPNNSAFPSIFLSGGEIAAVVIFIFVALWLIFFFHGCNHYMLCSSVSIWYFNNVNGEGGAPCGDSIWRLTRFHSGTVVFASLLNGFLFIIKLLANLFSFDTKEDDGCLVSCCLKFLSYLFCVFRM